MATRTDICNQALVLIGAASISDFATDTTKAGQLSRLFFHDSAEELLEQFPWTFATRRAELTTPIQDAPTFGFSYAFHLPADYLDIYETDLLDGEWRIEGYNLLSNSNPVSIVYIGLFEDTSRFSPLFRQTLIYLLAAKLAIPLTRSKEMATLYHQVVDRTLARSENANSHPNSQRFESDTLIAVRR